MEKENKELAVIKNADISLYGNYLSLIIGFEYGDGEQSLLRFLHKSDLNIILNVVNVDSFSELVGRPCCVLHNSERIIEIESWGIDNKKSLAISIDGKIKYKKK